MLTVGSLFSGIGGLELGLERAGMKTLWQVECDAYARRVLAKHWPSVTRHDDVRHVHGRVFGVCPEKDDGDICPGCLEPVDVLCGGFPCQDISVAGKGKGLQGERSGLWREFYRLIRELRPRYVLVENVPALRSRGLDVVLGNLAESGYDAEWDGVPAAALGALHKRDRFFLVAYPQCEFLREQPGRSGGTGGAGADVPRLFGSSGPPSRASTGLSQPRVDRAGDGVPNRVDRLRCLGNAVVPQVAEFIGRLIVQHARSLT
jgi:DNA (cytosine-5)-methyltransferase 1